MRLSRKPGLHQPRQQPRRVGGDRRVEVVERRAVERQHPPERDVARLERGPRAGAGRDAVRVDEAAHVGGGGRLRPGPRRRPHRLPGGRDLEHAEVVVALAGDLQADRQAGRVQPQLMLAAGCSLML